jgi:hypothetical protein
MRYIDVINELDIKLYNIRCRNWIKCSFNGTGKAGHLFEYLLDKQKDRYILPDYKCFEIKTKYINNDNGIKLFSCSFDSDPQEMKRFLNIVGYLKKDEKVYQHSINSKKGRCFDNGYIKVKVYRDSLKVKVLIYKNHTYITSFSWSFDELKNRLYTKLKYLMIVTYDIKMIKGEFYIKYLYANYYYLKSFDSFLHCIEEGYINISFNIKNNNGIITDKGTGFIINKDKIRELFYLLK